MTAVPDHPFKRIALCCSGGGYRAASFHLGAMAYLHRLRFQGRPLLENVKSLSTVSGGTITGVVYALKCRQGHTFPEIYSFLVEKLSSVDLVREGLNKLNVHSEWENPGKRRNLINAFSEIYDREFTGGETFDIFENMDNTHLEEVMFNSTEFSSGLIFRFQNDGRFGNYYNPVRRDLGGEVKLADIIAASSCFTGGFEPIEWPQDFIHSESVELKEAAPLLSSLGLMDGGIYDNQGIDSILLSEERTGAEAFDLILVSDVTSPYMKPFLFQEKKPETGWRNWTPGFLKARLRQIYQWFNWFLIVSLVCISAYLIFYFSNDLLSGILLATGIFLLCFKIILTFARKKLEKGLKSSVRYIRKALSDDLPLDGLASLKFSRIPFHHLEALLLDRINSLVSLVGEVFLKTVRRLVYGRLYDSDQHLFRRAANLIQALTRRDFESNRNRNLNDPAFFQNIPGCDPRLIGDYDQVVGNRLESIVDTAATFGTNLWFTETDKMQNVLPNLIISGQATMCFTLLKYLVELRHTPNNGYRNLPPHLQQDIEDLWQQCIADWQQFKTSPEFMMQANN